MSGRRRLQGSAAFVLALRVLALCLALPFTSGCFCTYGMWGWARDPQPESRVVGVKSASDGEATVILSLKACKDRPDGFYAMHIPAGWRDRATQRSKWGSEVPEISEPAGTLEPLASPPAGSEMTKPRRLGFPAVVGGRKLFSYGGRYGVIYAKDRGRFSAEVFGYVDARRGWVRLGGAQLDPGRASPARTAVAALCTPFALVADAVIVAGAAQGEGDFEMPAFPFEVPRLTAKLDQSHSRSRAAAAVELRRHGQRARVAVPALRRALAAKDRSVRAVAVTLKGLCPRDPDFYVPGVIDALRTGTPRGRRNAAVLLGDWRTEEAIPPLIEALRQDAAADVRSAALGALLSMDPRAWDAVPLLAEVLLRDGEYSIRREAAVALGLLGLLAWRAAPALEEALEDASRLVRLAARKALKSIQALVSEVVLTRAFYEHRPDETSPMAVVPVANETADMDYPPLVRGNLAPGLAALGYKVMVCGDCDTRLRKAGMTQAGQIALVDPETLADILCVDYAVFGNVESAGIRHFTLKGPRKVFTASFRMVHTPTGELLWKATGHGQALALFSIRDSIRGAVRNALATLPGPPGAAPSSPARITTDSPGRPFESPQGGLSVTVEGRKTAAPTPPKLALKDQAARYKSLIVRWKRERNATRKLEILQEALPEFEGTKYEKTIKKMIGVERFLRSH